MTQFFERNPDIGPEIQADLRDDWTHHDMTLSQLWAAHDVIAGSTTMTTVTAATPTVQLRPASFVLPRATLGTVLLPSPSTIRPLVLHSGEASASRPPMTVTPAPILWQEHSDDDDAFEDVPLRRRRIVQPARCGTGSHLLV